MNRFPSNDYVPEFAGMLMGKVRSGIEEGVRANLENARNKAHRPQCNDAETS